MIRFRGGMAAIVARKGLRSFPLDPLLTAAFFALVTLGLIMVASSSVAIADRIHGDPLYYFWRQSTAVAIGLLLGYGVLRTPLKVWERLSVPLLALAAILLLLVLIPGIGREVNGSMRWIDLGPVNLQSSEPAKLCVIAYLAGYLVRQGDRVRNSFGGFIAPILVVTVLAGLLLLEPDYGGAVVMFATMLGMLFMGGVPLTRFFAWMFAAAAVLGSLALHSPYRMQRLTSFLDPWQDPFNSGFQLTQALIAFGRGEWLGVGLGTSVQKLFYLPEAHTDFVFAVLAEEFGLAGSALVILLYSFVIWRAFLIANVAEQGGRLYAAYLAYGIGLIFGLQAFVNMGVNMGVLPTKGLTLPLMSYGSNSMVICCLAIALLIRVELENRGARHRSLPEVGTSYVA
ncbi:MAG: cell division protein FtsW [Gammaproteobacteria bacterium RIFCSPLOWO2_02_FULL_61_13]|nr:MAG: cell division protein FtsW [Gammaproteobacteria bacterium RIFCSPLOWO2_02_FULL_61_13]